MKQVSEEESNVPVIAVLESVRASSVAACHIALMVGFILSR